jgi:N-acetylmuramoyl-L-alanine amidase
MRGFAIFRSFLIVFGVGGMFATLLTLWTPAPLLSGDSGELFVYNPAELQPTLSADLALPTSVPTLAPDSGLGRLGIVAGHLGNDSGSTCPDGFTEAQVNLAVAQRVQQQLQAQGYAVDLLEEFDTRLSGYAAKALVSIHADSCSYINDLATGYKVAGALQNSVPAESARLVGCLITRYQTHTQMNYHSGSVTYDMTQYHAYREIDPTTPAAIIEVGFLALDREMLEKQPNLLAQGIIDGILCYLNGEPVQVP